jgi:hypothetical protein
LEAAVFARSYAPENDKDKLIAELQRTNRELTFVVQGYEELKAIKQDIERGWKGKVEILEQELQGRKEWVREVLKELEKEKLVSSPSPVYPDFLNPILLAVTRQVGGRETSFNRIRDRH